MYKKYIEHDAISTSEAIREKVSYEEKKIFEKITEDVSFIKNELACQMEGKDNRLEEEEKKKQRKIVAKLISSENSRDNVKQVLDEEFTEDSGLSRDAAIQQLVHENDMDLNETTIDIKDIEIEKDEWVYVGK